MREAAEKLDFEKAIELRDTISQLNSALSRKIENETSPENARFAAKRF